ncbi:hypothetical protein GCM10009077_02920 [Roseibium denhamense]
MHGVAETLFNTPKVIGWLDGELRPRREYYLTDILAELEGGNLLHIEPQTANLKNMDARMLEYGALALAAHGTNRKIIQIVYYTGDEPLPEKRYVEKKSYGCIGHRYYVVDAGAGNSEEFLAHENFRAACLGLLLREVPNFRQFSEKLIQRAIHELAPNDLAPALVSCVGMASIRRRSEIFMGEIPMEVQPEVREDSLFRKVHDDGVKEGSEIEKRRSILRLLKHQNRSEDLPSEIVEYVENSEVQSLDLLFEDALVCSDILAFATDAGIEIRECDLGNSSPKP